MRLCNAILLVQVQTSFGLQWSLGSWPLLAPGVHDSWQGLCEQYVDAILHDGPNSEDPHEQCHRHVSDLAVHGGTRASLNSKDAKDLCESLGAGLVALHLSGGLRAGDKKRNAEACSRLLSPHTVSFHLVEAPEPGSLEKFGEPVTNDTTANLPSTTTSTTPGARVKPVKLEEFGEGSQATTTTTSIATTSGRPKRFRMPEAYEPGKGPPKRFREPEAHEPRQKSQALDKKDTVEPRQDDSDSESAAVKVGPAGKDSAEPNNINDASAPAPAPESPAINSTENESNVLSTTFNKSIAESPQNISSTEDACAHCAAAARKKSAHKPDIAHGPEASNNEDVSMNGGRAGLLREGEVVMDTCNATVRQILKLIGGGHLKKEDVGGNVAPLCERQGRGELTRTLEEGDSLTRRDERALEELCFKLDGRVTMAIEKSALLPRATPDGMKLDETPESFCADFTDSTYPEQVLRAENVSKLADRPAPTKPPPPRPHPLQSAVHWASGLNGFHSACVNFLSEFHANVSDSIQLTLRRYQTPEGRNIKISQAFPWSGDLQGFKTCQEDLSEALNRSGSEPVPIAFRGKDWPQRICFDLALGYMKVKSAELEAPQGLVADAPASTALSGATPNVFCRTYEAQFAQGESQETVGENSTDKGQNSTEKDSALEGNSVSADGDPSEGDPSTGPTSEGGLSGQMSGNEDPPKKPKLTRSTSANHAEQKQHGTEKKTHWMTGSMPGPNHEMRS